ncbi:hypothetical protein Tco_0389355 [Tanacetum coccineum]
MKKFSFIKELGHKGDIKSVTDVVVDQMHQPLRTFAAIINKCLSEKIIDFTFQIENRDTKKQEKIYYPRFTKVVIHHFISKDKSISIRSRMFMHTAQDDSILGPMRFVYKADHYQVYGNDLWKLEGIITQDNYNRDLILKRREERSLNNNSFLDEYKCSSLALNREERRDEKKILDHLKQDQTMLVIKRFSERKKIFRGRKKTGKIHAKSYKTKLENTCNNDKNLSEIQLKHGREDELVVVVVKVVHECRMVVKEIEDGLLEEMEKFGWWFEQDINGENEDGNEKKLVMVNEEGWMS